VTIISRQYVHDVDALGQMTVIMNWTMYSHIGSDDKERLNQLSKTEGLLKGITGHDTGGKENRPECLIL